MNLAKVNTNFAAIASHAFRYKYPDRPISIEGNFRYPNETLDRWVTLKPLKVAGFSIEVQPVADGLQRLCQKKKPAYELKEKEIVINDYYMMIDVFKYLRVPNAAFLYRRFKTNQTKIMDQLISNYSESLEKVTFEYCTENSLEFITKPLVNAKIVKFRYSTDRFSHETLQIHVLFPAIEELHLAMWATNLDYFASHMPNLRHLYMQGEEHRYTTYEHFNTGINYVHVMRRNPQLRSVEAGDIRGKYIEVMGSLLPNLQMLTLSRFKMEFHVWFENVTTFTARFASNLLTYDHYPDTPKYLHFPKLEKLEFQLIRSTGWEHIPEWIQFLENHRQVSRFVLICKAFSDEGFEQLMAELPNLVNMTMDIKEDAQVIGSNVIVKLLESHENLLQFHLIYRDISMKASQADFDRLDYKWIVQETENGFFFKRCR